jgi:hypothetical protein
MSRKEPDRKCLPQSRRLTINQTAGNVDQFSGKKSSLYMDTEPDPGAAWVKHHNLINIEQHPNLQMREDKRRK